MRFCKKAERSAQYLFWFGPAIWFGEVGGRG